MEHVAEPMTFEYCPAGHSVHTASFVPREPLKLVPTGHCKQEGNPTPEYVPGPHDTQSLIDVAPDPT